MAESINRNTPTPRHDVAKADQPSRFAAGSRQRPAEVAALWLYHVRLPLRTTITHASHSRRETENLIVECVLTDGTCGFGEGVPRDYVTGETIVSSTARLRQTDWAHYFTPLRSFEAAANLARDFTLANVAAAKSAVVNGADANGHRHHVGNAARCAVELAFLDAFGQFFGRPVGAVGKLFADLRPLYAPRSRCQYGAVITSKSARKEFFAALKYRIVCFRDCKIKVGTPGQDDQRRLNLFRQLLTGMTLRLDANEAWQPTEALERLRQFLPYRVACVEQPIPHAASSTFAQLRHECRQAGDPAAQIPIMLDESLCSLVDAQQCVASKLAEWFNLRLSKCGGYLKTLELAAFAQRHAIACQLGCQVGESGLLSAAGRQFACHTAGLRFLEGSYDRFLLKNRIIQQDISFGFGGYAPRLSGAGLGVSVDRRQLQRATIQREQLYGR